MKLPHAINQRALFSAKDMIGETVCGLLTACYPIDQAVGLESYQRVSCGVGLGLVETAREMSYAKASRMVTGGQVSKLTQSYGITPSMSSKGNPYDNAMAENFFSILKTKCIYRHKPKTFREANDLIDRYMNFYKYERIQIKTGAVYNLQQALLCLLQRRDRQS